MHSLRLHQPFRIHQLRAIAAATLALLISACASQSTSTTATNNTHNQPAGQQAEAKGSFEAATLYALLVAELAGQRGMNQVSIHNYVQEAERTRDINITRHATLLANRYNDANNSLKAALLWTELEPNNPEPSGIAAAGLIRRGDIEQARPLLQSALTHNPSSTVDALAERAQKMSPQERKNYLTLLDQLLLDNPEQPHLLYAKASLLRFSDDLSQPLLFAQQALDLAPQYDRAILLEADLQARSGHLDTALGHLREELNRRDHQQIRTLYTRLLLQKGQFDSAHQQAQLLTKNAPNDHNLQFYLGALMLEYNQIEQSEQYFLELVQRFGVNSTLHYYLGRIAQLKELPDQALEHYQQIGDSAYLTAGMSEVAKLLNKPKDEQQLRDIYRQSRERNPAQSATLFIMEASWLQQHQRQQQALQVYNQALAMEPHATNPQLLYNRSMLHEQLDQLDEMEQDLRQLLALEPNNATALNALGYSLTDRTDRHEEALILIRQALKLKPDDPAILDSMGWVQHNLGNYKLALEYLLRALEMFPDPEIAGHLGQVYWKLGQQDNAREVWDNALQSHPDSPLILEAMRQVGLTQ
ncbi:MAG: tetratricopeptide repeat protein [Motiliproteus sp.]